MTENDVPWISSHGGQRQFVSALLSEAGYQVASTPEDTAVYDLIAERMEDRKLRRIAIRCGPLPGLRQAEIKAMVRTAAKGNLLTDFWYVDNDKMTLRVKEDELPLTVEAWSLEKLADRMRQIKSSARRESPSSGKGAAATAVIENDKQITLSIATAELLIETNLAVLMDQKPNSDEAAVALRREIRNYEELREHLASLRTAITQFKKDKAKVLALEKSVVSFGAGFEKWWKASHKRFLDRSADGAVFLTLLGLSSWIGVHADMAALVSAALVGGRSIAGALREAAKRIAT